MQGSLYSMRKFLEKITNAVKLCAPRFKWSGLFKPPHVEICNDFQDDLDNFTKLRL